MRLTVVLLLAAALALAGCTREGESTDTNVTTTPPGTTVTPTGTGTNTSASFVVANVSILAPDGTARQLYEDDRSATVRYVVLQPDGAPRKETAFVTYVLNGRIADVQQVTLSPGENKTFEREVEVNATTRAIEVEVRAGSSREDASATVKAWPRHGEPLTIGPYTIRADHGLQEVNGRVLVNLSVEHRAGGPNATELRVKMVCADAKGDLQPRTSVPIAAPTPGNTTMLDVHVDDCEQTRYALEFKANGDEEEFYGRILLVPPGWTPPTQA